MARLRRRGLAVVIALALSGLAVALVLRRRRRGRTELPEISTYEHVTVSFLDADGQSVGTIDARVADTERKQYVGLSDTDSLGDREGMLFVHEAEAPRSYVMREMSFPLDIVFVSADRTVTAVHHAELPPPGTAHEALERYQGQAQFVIEVPYGYAGEIGVEPGDRIRIESAGAADDPSA